MMSQTCNEQVRTEDLGGYATTTEFTTAVIENIGKQPIQKTLQK